jgi:hypothetical protein
MTGVRDFAQFSSRRMHFRTFPFLTAAALGRSARVGREGKGKGGGVLRMIARLGFVAE